MWDIIKLTKICIMGEHMENYMEKREKNEFTKVYQI